MLTGDGLLCRQIQSPMSRLEGQYCVFTPEAYINMPLAYSCQEGTHLLVPRPRTLGIGIGLVVLHGWVIFLYRILLNATVPTAFANGTFCQSCLAIQNQLTLSRLPLIVQRKPYIVTFRSTMAKRVPRMYATKVGLIGYSYRFLVRYLYTTKIT